MARGGIFLWELCAFLRSFYGELDDGEVNLSQTHLTWGKLHYERALPL
jgi:hypothetical protein